MLASVWCLSHLLLYKYMVAREIKFIAKKTFSNINYSDWYRTAHSEDSYLISELNSNENSNTSNGFDYIRNMKEYDLFKSKYNVDLPKVDFDSQEMLIVYGKSIEKIFYFLGRDGRSFDVQFAFVLFSDVKIKGIEIIVCNSKKYWLKKSNYDEILNKSLLGFYYKAR